jgi:hypothetical protein
MIVPLNRNVQRRRGKVILGPTLTRSLAILGIAAVFAGPVSADHIPADIVSAKFHPCAEDSGGVGSCTANEIDIAETTSIHFISKPTECVLGDTLFADGVNAKYGLNTGVRYDPLLWVGQKGNDPRNPDPNLDPGDEMVGSCFVTSAPEHPNLILSLEEDEAEDSCHDISNPGVPEVELFYPTGFNFECQDADADGFADVHVLVTWVQNTNLLCGNDTDEMFGTGAPPKCNYTLIDLEIPIVQPPPPSLTVAKVIESDSGGAATLDDFDVSVDGEEVDWSDPSSTTGGSELVATQAGTYTLSETDVEGYAEGIWSCLDQDDQEVPVTNGGLFSGADVTVAEGRQVTCSITNTDDAPALTLIKAVVNDDGGEAGPGDFQLRLDGGIYVNAPFGSGASPPVTAGTPYTLSEDPFPGYDDLGVVCFDEGAGEVVPHPVTLALGQVVTCTLSNNDQPPPPPSLTLLKSVINDDGGEAGPGDFQLRLNGGIYVNAAFGSGDSPPVAAGTPYTLSEDPFPGYDDLGVVCFDEGAGEVVPHPVILAPGQVVTCTLTNNDQPPPVPTLTLLKSVTNDDGGTAEPGDFTLRLNGGIYVNAPFGSGDSPPVAAGTPYTLSEDVFPGYSDTGVSCFDEGAEEIVPHPVTLSEGQVVTCTIANDDTAPQLTLIKSVINDDGGEAEPGDFQLRLDGGIYLNAPFSSGDSPPVAANTAYTLSEDVDPDYLDEGVVCFDEGAGEVVPHPVTLALDQVVTCTLTNNDIDPIEPRLFLIKSVTNDNGGEAEPGDFQLRLDGDIYVNAPFSSGDSPPVVAGTPYTLSEDPFPGYDELGVVCFDEGAEEEVPHPLTLDPGQVVTCTLTNDDEEVPIPSEQSLTVTKIIVSDDGGTATVKDFEVSVDGIEVNWPDPESPTGDTEVVADLPNTYVLSEADLDGYEEGAWTCSDKFGEVPVGNDGHFSGADVVVAAGQQVHCSITNDDIFVPEPGLVVVKVIRSVNGGTATLDDFDVSVNGVEVNWQDPGSVTGGSRFVSGKPGTYTLSEADVDGYMEGRWSCRDYKYLSVPISNDGHFSGADVTVAPAQQVTCTITNNDLKPQPDVSVTKRTEPDIGECAVIVGQQLDFSIEAANAGPGTAEGVILEDHWSWQLKLSRAPDMIECSDPVERSIRCKLGNMEPGTSKEISLGFMVGGNPGEEACNLARVSSYPDDYGDPADNEAEICFDLVGRLMLATASGCGELPAAMVGVPYDESIAISGGQPPYQAEFEGLPDDFSGAVVNGAVRIQGCATEPGAGEFTVTVSDRAGCQDTAEAPAVCTLIVEQDPDCPMGALVPAAVPPAGAPTPDADVLPDESVQKVALDRDRNRYLVGFAYRDHSYGDDPNGPYVDHSRNYDIRVVKYDDDGRLIWDKTYDTGNDDYGYAIALDFEAAQPALFVGGGVEVETGAHAWHEALLLEIDPATGCPAGKHFQSAGKGTTSAYYDIATDGDQLYAVGERQRNEQLVGEFGALISIFSHAAFAGPEASCEGNHHIIGYPPPAGPDPALIGNLLREGGLIPTVAYSVKVPGAGCVDCPVLVGGRSDAGGWVDAIVGGDTGLAAFLAPGSLGDISIQDMAVPGDRVIVVGSSSENDMRILGYNRAGSALWAPKALGKGRLRGVADDASGAFYAVGRTDDESSAGLIFKFDAAGGEIDRDQLTQGSGASFTDVAVFRPGNGLIAGRSDESQYDYTWFQIEFDCDLPGGCAAAGD